VRYSSLERGFQAGNPIASLLVIIVGSLVIAASIVVGFFAFLIVGSLLLVLAAVVSIRLWWFRRKMARDPSYRAQVNERADVTRQTIEGEYRIVVEEKEDRPR
jgi:membrane protein implicated in regulation of membrane protease activity